MVKIDITTSMGRKEVEAFSTILKVMKEMTETTCKYCGSPNVVRNGRSKKDVQNWLCRNCGKGFVASNALPRMKSPINHVGSAMYLYFTGSSLNEIRRHIEQQHGVLPSDATIYNWVIRFSKIAVDKTKEYTPEVGDTWVGDETMLDVGGKKLWLIDIIDKDTRYLLATRLSASRGKKDIALNLRRAYLKAKKAPKRIITDGWKVYPDAVDLVFGSDTKHISSKPFVEVDSTNIIERFHGTLKDRTKVMRGFKKPESARLILDGFLVYYNFFRPHESLNDKTPAEVAKIKFPYKDWLDVVKSQSPTFEVPEQDKLLVISTNFSNRRAPYIRRGWVSRKRAERMITPTISTIRGRRI